MGNKIILPEGGKIFIKQEGGEWEELGRVQNVSFHSTGEATSKGKTTEGQPINLNDMKIVIPFEIIEFNNTIRGDFEIVEDLQLEDKRTKK